MAWICWAQAKSQTFRILTKNGYVNSWFSLEYALYLLINRNKTKETILHLRTASFVRVILFDPPLTNGYHTLNGFQSRFHKMDPWLILTSNALYTSYEKIVTCNRQPQAKSQTLINIAANRMRTKNDCVWLVSRVDTFEKRELTT